MTVTILRPLEMADAGRARMLHVGQVAHDLSDVVAQSLIASGAAVLVESAAAARERAVAVVPESGRQRRRR
jgi:hypothetical protein